MSKAYKFNQFTLRVEMVESLELYVKQGIPCGSFLESALCNNFKDTVAGADAENIQNLPALAGYMYWEMPANSQGSPELVKSWLKSFQEQET